MAWKKLAARQAHKLVKKLRTFQSAA